MPDEIIEELWRVKDELAREHGYDVRALAAYLQNKEQTEGRRVVDLGAMKSNLDKPIDREDNGC